MVPVLYDLSQELLAFTDRVLESLTFDRCQQLATSNGGDTEFKGTLGQPSWRFFKWFILTLEQNEKGRYAWLCTEVSDSRSQGKGSSMEPVTYGAWIFEDGHVERFSSPK
jgi:hypothetical protein